MAGTEAPGQRISPPCLTAAVPGAEATMMALEALEARVVMAAVEGAVGLASQEARAAMADLA